MVTEATTRWVGRAVRRLEDPRFLRGQARYVDDIVLPQMAYLAVVRSAVAHAQVRRVDVRAAAAGPAVLTVVVGTDLAGSISPVPPNAVEGAQVAPVPHPVLAQDRVRYVGEPVAAVLAETRAAAEDAASLIDIEYDMLPVITDPLQAQSAAALHGAAPQNVLLRWVRSSGDVQGAFASASRIVAQRFHIPRLAAAPIEPRGAVASYDPGTDRLTVWCSAQDPHRPLAQLSRALSRPDDRIRVIVPDVGGAFGSKGAVPVEVILAAWLAMRVGRPVKWVEDRRDNLAASYQGRGLDAEIEIALDAGGTIRALRARLTADLGAYLFPSTPVVPVTTAMLLTGTYAIPAAAVELVGVATNKVPTGPYRGAGRPEAAYLLERVVELAAHEVGIDPVALRRRNLVSADQFPYRTPLGFTYDSGNYARALERACTLLDYDRWRRDQAAARQEGRLVGIGVAMYVERAGSAVWGCSHHRAGRLRHRAARGGDLWQPLHHDRGIRASDRPRTDQGQGGTDRRPLARSGWAGCGLDRGSVPCARRPAARCHTGGGGRGGLSTWPPPSRDGTGIGGPRRVPAARSCFSFWGVRGGG